MIHLVRRNNQTGAHLLDFVAYCRIQIHQKDVETVDYHFHPSIPHAV